MEPYQQQQISRGIFRFGCYAFFLVLIIWKIPIWIEELQTEIPEAPTEEREVFDIHSFLQEHTLTPHSEDIYKDIYFATFLLSEPEIYTQKLQTTLQEENIEHYLLSLDGLDQEMYIYLNGILAHRLLFIRDISQQTTNVPPEKIEWPQLALIIGGMGEKNRVWLTQHPTPMSFAFSPIAPFSYSLATHAKQNMHEILVDMRTAPSVAEPQELLPFASGVLYSDIVRHKDPFVTTLYPSKGKDTQERNPLSTQTRSYVDMPFAIARSKQIAQKRGFAALLIEADDPQLPLLLSWSAQAHQEGIRLVMASEIRYGIQPAPLLPKK